MCQLISRASLSCSPIAAADVDDHDWDDPENVSDQILEALDNAERPIIIAGNGVRFSQTTDMLREFGERLSIPITTVWNAHDLIPNSHPSFCGRAGSDGDRAGNFSVQNADLIIILGARMAIRQVGFNHEAFGRAARQIMVDVDPFEMQKPTLRIDQKFLCDLRLVMPELLSRGTLKNQQTHTRVLLAGAVKRWASIQPY